MLTRTGSKGRDRPLLYEIAGCNHINVLTGLYLSSRKDGSLVEERVKKHKTKLDSISVLGDILKLCFEKAHFI